MKSNLLVIIVTHDSEADIGSCLESLPEAAGTVPHEVVVVDNASRDETRVVLDQWRKGDDSRHVVYNVKNIGLARAVNQGMALARPGWFSLISVLNPDVQACPGSLEALAGFLRERPDVGLALPKLLDPEGRLQPSCRTFYDAATVFARRTPLLNRFLENTAVVRKHLMADYDHRREQEVDWGQGAAFMVRADALERNDVLYDPRYFLYFEDVDLAWSMWSRGYKVVYLPDSVMMHRHKRASAGSGIATFHHFVSALRFMAKNKPWKGSPRKRNGTREDAECEADHG